MGVIAFGIDALSIRVTGLRPAEEAALVEQWGIFRIEPPPHPWIDARIAHRPGGPLAAFDAKGMRVTREPLACLVSMPAARARVPDAGALDIELEGENAPRNALAVLNVLHAAIAWRIADRGGFLLHAASAVLGGRGFALVGAEGAGKSTWARGMRREGATVLGDDIALVLPSASGFDLIGSPLRAKEFGGGVPGRWPLAAILLPRHAKAPSLEPASNLEAQAALTANLPFLMDRGAGAPSAAIEALSRVPVRRLGFTEDDPGATLLVGVMA